MELGVKRVKGGSGDCAVVFVHGILSDGERCWKHEQGTYWPDLLAAEDSSGLLSIFVYTYQSDMFSADYNLDDVVDDLRQRLRDVAVESFGRIIFVCHSMGGIVARRYLVRRQLDVVANESENRVFGLLLVASPSLGSDWGRWLGSIAKSFQHSQADALRFSKNNRWLDTLDRDFRDLKESGRLALHGRELIEDKFIVLHKFFFFPKVVERLSGNRYFGEALKIAGSDHFSIAKPKDAGALQHTVLCGIIADIQPDFVAASSGSAAGRSPASASGDKFAVAVARLEGDQDRQEFKKLVRAMQDFFQGIEVHEVPRTITLTPGNQDAVLAAGHAEARRVLRDAGVNALLWGEVLSAGTDKQLRLHWTLPDTTGGVKSTERYTSASNFDLPPLFWDDLSITLAAVVTTSAAEMLGTAGRFVADRLKDLLPKTANLVRTARERWNEYAWAEVALVHATTAYVYGVQAGDNDALIQAVSTYRELLAGPITREKVPLDWAMTQDNLGNALAILGERESGTTRLEAAVHAYEEALKERTREKVPLAWAATQHNLGNALQALGERESGTIRLEAAMHAYEEALKERTREKVSLAWATTQNNLGNALAILGQRESGTKRLEGAVLAYEETLKEYTREKVPLAWAATQHNLGAALQTLGQRESSTTRLEAAVRACEEALKERTREKVPLDWAMTQDNLGNALAILGERESGTKRLEAAVHAYEEALKERTREKVPLDWAATQNNLGNALRALGERESGTTRLEAAMHAYEEALKERTREKVPLAWATTQNNLGNALRALGERESGTTRLEAAVRACEESLKECTREKVPLDWAMTQDNLGNALWALGKRESGTTRLEAAVHAYEEALKERTREKVPMDWAKTQNNFGNSLSVMGERLSDSAMLHRAIGVFNVALPVAQSGKFSRLADAIQEAREHAMRILERHSGAGDNEQESKGG